MTLVPSSSHGAATAAQTSDPGASGAGSLWLNTTSPGSGVPSTARPLLVRNAADDGWIEVQSIHRDSTGVVRGFLTFSDSGIVMQLLTATSGILGEWYFFSSGGKGYSDWIVSGSAGQTRLRIDTGGTDWSTSMFGVNVATALWGASIEGVEQFHQSAAPAAPSQSFRKQWYDDTTAAPKMRFSQADAAGTVTSGVVEAASPITAGALPTQAFVSGAGAQLLTQRAVETITPVATDGSANPATCAVALSPDNTTYSTVVTVTASVAVNTVGSVTLPVNVRVPAGWYLKLTVSHATLGTTTYY